MFNAVIREELVTIKCGVSYTCDRCKKVYEMDTCQEIQEFLHINFVGGYSSVFGDEATVSADICQHCLKELIGSFCIIT
jgi:antitoxin CcdA